MLVNWALERSLDELENGRIGNVWGFDNSWLIRRNKFHGKVMVFANAIFQAMFWRSHEICKSSLFLCNWSPTYCTFFKSVHRQAEERGAGSLSLALTLSHHLVGRTPRPRRSPGCSSVWFLFNLFFSHLTGDPFCLWVIRTKRFYYFSLGCGWPVVLFSGLVFFWCK